MENTPSIPMGGSTAPGAAIASDGPLAYWACLLIIVAKGMLSSKLRQILTYATMAIGSMALAATLFAGKGALTILWQDLDRLMGNRVLVHVDPNPNSVLLANRPSLEFTMADLEYVRASLPPTLVRYVAPRYFGKAHISYFSRSKYMSVDGIAAAQAQDPIYTPFTGSGFSADTYAGKRLECMLTRYAAEVLGIRPGQNAWVRIDNQRFTVKGLVPNPPGADRQMRGRVIVPYLISQMLWGEPGRMHTLVVSWRAPEKMEATIALLRKALDTCRSADSYHLSASDFRMRKRKNIVSNFMAFGMAQAFFCILVASIGVVNVMLANVVQRAKEFAIRIAMGARHRDIIIIVLVESTMIGLVGASLGVLAAIFAAPPLCQLISARIPEASQLRPLFSLQGILLPFFVCGMSGLLAGTIPAIKAGRLDILKLLRSE